MIASFSPHIDILPEAQLALWPSLATVAALGFVLYGGTAIALRLGHRVSVDFDFFSNAQLDRARLFDAMPVLRTSRLLQEEENTLTAEVLAPLPVKVSFFGGLGFGRAGRPEKTGDGVLHVASLLDLMAAKLKVILQRIEAKDYQDIAAMIGADVSLADGLAAARALYGSNFQPSESLKALTWFQGGNLALLTKDEKTLLVAAAAAVREIPQRQRISALLSYSEIQE